MEFRLHVNGREHTVEAEPETSLLVVLREHLGLTGSKYGCGEGQCGACTVLLDGLARRSCITPVRQAVGHRIVTIEGLAGEHELHPVQKAFLEAGAFQCGYCTPGMILTAVALLTHNPSPTEEDTVTFLNGNLCRCGTYPRIVAAVRRAAAQLREGRS